MRTKESLSTCCAISLPKALLKEIDEMRIWNKQSSRSSWVVTAIKERVERERLKRLEEVIRAK